MKIIVSVPNADRFAGCAYYRSFQPHKVMAEKFNVPTLIVNGLKYLSDEQIREYDIFHCHKAWINEDYIDRARRLGLKIIIDFDDYWRLPADHYLYNSYYWECGPDGRPLRKDGVKVKKLPSVTDRLIGILRLADFVTVTTDLLAREVERINPNVCVLPNAIDVNSEQYKPKKIESSRIRIGWIGGHCHNSDIEELIGLQNALRIDSQTKGKYLIRLFGYDGSRAFRYFADIMSGNHNPGEIETEGFQVFRKADVWNYTEFYNHIDIAIIPLVDNKFNSLKSELKVIEAGFFKKAAVVSNVDPYKSLLKHKENSLVVNKHSDWFRHLKYLIINPSEIQRLGENLYKDVQEFNQDKVSEKRFKFYERCLKEVPLKQPALT